MEKKFLDLEGLQRYNQALKNGSLVVGKAATANGVKSDGIVWGNSVIPLKNIPPAALERITVVADDAARLKLTTATVQTGDTVKVTATKKMYFVKDDTKLNSEAGYEEYVAGIVADSVAWDNITGRPDIEKFMNQTEKKFNSVRKEINSVGEKINSVDTESEQRYADIADRLFYSHQTFDSFIEDSKPGDIVFDTNFVGGFGGAFAKRKNTQDVQLEESFSEGRFFGQPGEPSVEGGPFPTHAIPYYHSIYFCKKTGLFYMPLANVGEVGEGIKLVAIKQPSKTLVQIERIVSNVTVEGEAKEVKKGTPVYFDKTSKQFVCLANIHNQTYFPLKDVGGEYGYFDGSKTTPFDGKLYYIVNSNSTVLLTFVNGDYILFSDTGDLLNAIDEVSQSVEDIKAIPNTEIDALFK